MFLADLPSRAMARSTCDREPCSGDDLRPLRRGNADRSGNSKKEPLMSTHVSARAAIWETAAVGKRASRALKAHLRGRIGLVLADAHPIVLQGMQHLFHLEPDLDVLACCTSEEETLSAVDRYQPGILVLDPLLPGRGGLALLGELTARRLPPRVVLLAGSASESEMAEALRLGVRGVVLKATAPELLVACIRSVNQGAIWLETASASAVLDRIVRREAGLDQLKDTLTRRELEILRLAAGGL